MFLKLKLRIFLLSSKTLLFDSFVVGFFHHLIIELKPFPFLVVFYEGIVMTGFRCASMDNDTPQLIIIKLIFSTLCSQQILACVFFHIKLLRVFELVIDFNFGHIVKVISKPFEDDHHDVRQLFYTQSLHCSHFLVALFAVIGIVAI